MPQSQYSGNAFGLLVASQISTQRLWRLCVFSVIPYVSLIFVRDAPSKPIRLTLVDHFLSLTLEGSHVLKTILVLFPKHLWRYCVEHYWAVEGDVDTDFVLEPWDFIISTTYKADISS